MAAEYKGKQSDRDARDDDRPRPGARSGKAKKKSPKRGRSAPPGARAARPPMGPPPMAGGLGAAPAAPLFPPPGPSPMPMY